MEDLVSVVIPVFNAEQFLDRCLKSIISQTYKKLEIILINDGSSDNSLKVCEKWSQTDERIKVIHKENAGAGMARNDGILSAKGKYIMFVDSDDYIDEKTVEKCVFDAQKNDADLVMLGRCEVLADGNKKNKPVTTSKLLFDGESVLSEILPGLFVYEKGIGISVWGKLFRLDRIKDNGILFKSERELFSEDAYFLLELFKHIQKVKIIPENLYYYCNNENSFSRTYKKEHTKLNDVFLNESLNLCKKNGYPPRVFECIKARYQYYSMAGMKHLVASDATQKEKNKELNTFFRSKVLYNTVTGNILKYHTAKSKLFWISFKLRCKPTCVLMLMAKTRK